jgi:hypothetical protein
VKTVLVASEVCKTLTYFSKELEKVINDLEDTIFIDDVEEVEKMNKFTAYQIQQLTTLRKYMEIQNKRFDSFKESSDSIQYLLEADKSIDEVFGYE